MEKYHLFPISGRAVVAMSGGQDSVLLWHTLKSIQARFPQRISQIRAIHIDHSLRKDSAIQAKALQENYPDLKIIKIAEAPPVSDVEAWARRNRHALLKAECSQGDRLYMGHHIDDSMEWFLRQLLASSGQSLKMGIPLTNGLIARPFHCLSRRQIERFVKELHLFYVQDASNFDIRYQRNFLRHEIFKPLAQVFPQGAAHFVEKANDWANQIRNQGRPNIELEKKTLGRGCFLFIRPQKAVNWGDFRAQIREGLHELSSHGRGQILRNLNKLLLSLDSGHGAKGPFYFSGGVKVFCYPGMLILCNEIGLQELSGRDRELSSLSSDLFLDQFSDQFFKDKLLAKYKVGDLNLDKIDFDKTLPFLFYRAKDYSFLGKKKAKGRKSDLLFPTLCRLMSERGYSFHPITFLNELKNLKQKNNKGLSQKEVFLVSLPSQTHESS
jgi:tRNA(Ile)-lysidine synthase